MTTFTIYPAIDLFDGKVVRLRQGKKEEKTVYADSPADMASKWVDQGAEWLHVVNLNGAFGEQSVANRKAIEDILVTVGSKAKVQIGGGLRSIDDIRLALDMKIDRVILGTAIIRDPEFGEAVLRKFGGERIVLGLDAKGQELMAQGWQSGSGQNLIALAKRFATAGAKTAIYTNIQRDGMQTGVDWALAKTIADETGLDVIASGGAKSIEDIKAAKSAGLGGIIIGRALYEGNFTLKEALDVC
ncbi:1-(5-phosphoribosyl)-5-[(5-phosphoribosylamino)methylideneamino]imidazole-4-carboxamide isomerase [bacterium]|nr:1-(5-phosphoribosyl)-5-[(5-phosphoribosylamino)methylideneamino]imidazole-4-carboxamide isomerase [bacterium]